MDNHNFVTESDWIPNFWNYLLGLNRNDLIAELIQNDLDQDATRTIITFEKDKIVCEGNGKPVDEDGWKRLRKIQGAGNEVTAKQGKIGVKNHGLKTAFSIGDEIVLMSDGKEIIQTLYANRSQNAPHPGASKMPVTNRQAPAVGCRIIIKYRQSTLEPPQGEASTLKYVTQDDIDSIFMTACVNAPEQFIGIVSPEKVTRYEIILRHWKLGDLHLKFSCSRPKKIGRNLEVFRRRCKVSGTTEHKPDNIHEQAASKSVPTKGRLRRRVADFFRWGNRAIIEVSWPVDSSGKPKIGTGRFRYPIGYPKDSQHAITGLGANFNAPFVSDNARHGPAHNESSNEDLRSACEALLVDALTKYAIPKWQAAGLNPLLPTEENDSYEKKTRSLLESIIQRNAMPTVKWRDVVRLLGKRKRSKKSPVSLNNSSRGYDKASSKYKFIIPVMTWDYKDIHTALSVISPPTENQIDPLVHPTLIGLIWDEATEGYCKDFITFDQNDAISLANGIGNDYFNAPDNYEKEFSQPYIARTYLDVINDAIENEKCDEDTQNTLLENLLIPDLNGIPVPLKEIHTSIALPSDVPGLDLPPILHPELIDHPIFKRKKWYRRKYTFAQFLESDVIDSCDEKTRARFWNWLQKNERHISQRDRSKIAEIPIWPDINGNLCAIGDLCAPSSRKITAILKNFINQPHKKVLQSKLVTIGKRGRNSVRRKPTEEELEIWLNHHVDKFAVFEKADDNTQAALESFEEDLTNLLKDRNISPVLKTTEVTLPSLAADGFIRNRNELVMPSQGTSQFALLKRFLLKNHKHAPILNKLSPVLSEPTADMLLESLKDDPGNYDALQPRLKFFLEKTQPYDDRRSQIVDLPIIPLKNKRYAPRSLAFVGHNRDYWGDWKIRLDTKGLSQEDQKRYREVGVTSSQPEQETSIEFFKWLDKQPEEVLRNHIPCILRHILHKSGPTKWAETYVDIPFIPAKNRNGYRIVSLQHALKRPVYIPDNKIIADNILEKDARVLLVIDTVKEVTEPVRDQLRSLGIRSLNEALKEPVSVLGVGNTKASTSEEKKIRYLRSSQMRKTLQKRLTGLGLELFLLRRDWYDRLSKIQEIRFADEVLARYRFRNRIYQITVDGGFDFNTGIFWISNTTTTKQYNIYEVIASQLIFKPEAKPFHYLALERAINIEITDPSFGKPESADTIENDAGKILNAVDSDFHDDYLDEKEKEEILLGEARFGHSPFKPDPSRNMPDPTPITNVAEKSYGRNIGDKKKTGSISKSADSDTIPDIEVEHKESLKKNHYASHCQICLCREVPAKLAPRGSYIQYEEVRRKVIEAHHVDPKSAGGARHAGNLILLCNMHHNNYGRQLSREMITKALRNNPIGMSVEFTVDRKNKSVVSGPRLTLNIPETAETIEVFFTKDHAKYWLSMAPER